MISRSELTELVTARRPALVKRAVSLLRGNVEWAEDVVQVTLEYVFRNLDKFDESKSAPETWLFTIINRRCYNALRDYDRAVRAMWQETSHFGLAGYMRTSARAVGHTPACDVQAEHEERRREEERAWDALKFMVETDDTVDPMTRVAIYDHFWGGKSWVDIAHHLGRPRTTLNARSLPCGRTSLRTRPVHIW